MNSAIEKAAGLVAELSQLIDEIDDPTLLLRIKQIKQRFSTLTLGEIVWKLETGTSVDMPADLTAAPELFKRRADKSEKASVFLRRVYGRWINEKTLGRHHVRKLDLSLYRGLANECSVGGNENAWSGVPTKSTMIDGRIAQMTNSRSLNESDGALYHAYKERRRTRRKKSSREK